MFNPFYGFVLECEGDIPTREGLINQAIKLMRYEHMTIQQACDTVGLDFYSLTDSEKYRMHRDG